MRNGACSRPYISRTSCLTGARGRSARRSDALAREHPVSEPRGVQAAPPRGRRRPLAARLPHRRGAALRDRADRAAARPARRAPGHSPFPGQHPGTDRGRLGDRARSQRHEGRVGGDDRARALGGRPARSHLRPGVSVLRPRRAAERGECVAPGVRGGAIRPRIGPRRDARAHGQRDPRRVSREPQRDASCSGGRALTPPVPGRA